MKRPLRKSIIVIGEGITEKYYFQHLKRLSNYNIKVRPRFFQKTNSIAHIIKKVEEVISADAIAICVFDADVSQRNKSEKEHLKSLYQNYGQNDNVIICDTFPAIEYWVLIHFVYTNRMFANYKELRNALRRYLEDYDKTEKYLKNDNWVNMLFPHFNVAVERAKIFENANGSYSKIYKAIEYLELNK